MWKPDGAQGFESRKIKYLLPLYAQGNVLEIGCGQEKAYPTYVGFDKFGGAANLLGDAAHLSILADEAFDTVFSSHCLEDFEDMSAVLNEWARVLKDGGNMILYLPSANFYPRMGEEGANPDHKHDIYPDDIPDLFAKTDFDWEKIVLEERSQDDEYSIFVVYKKLKKGCGLISVYEKPEKTVCIYRTGGFGDVLMAAGVLSSLKREGYHVSFMTDLMGKCILHNNPNVDQLLLVDTQSMQANDVYNIWIEMHDRFDKWINLQNSVENALLSFPYTVEYFWPEHMRHERFNKNYMEFIFELAELSFAKDLLYYPTEKEIEYGKKLCRSEDFNIVFCVGGSAVNKKNPLQDIIIGAILASMPEARVFLVGDERVVELQNKWIDHPRVVCLCNKQRIRETLALAHTANLVIGPETGVLNAICYTDIPKIIYLSHSSKENLTKHWNSTCTLIPKDIDCYPCHKLHYNPRTCDVGIHGGSACVVSILPMEYIEPVVQLYLAWLNSR